MSTMPEILDALFEMGPQGIARFEASIDPDWIRQALAATGTATVRRRKLPAEQVVWLVVGMSLFADRSIVGVVDHLALVLPKVTSTTEFFRGSRSRKFNYADVEDKLGPTPGLGRDYLVMAAKECGYMVEIEGAQLITFKVATRW